MFKTKQELEYFIESMFAITYRGSHKIWQIFSEIKKNFYVVSKLSRFLRHPAIADKGYQKWAP